jgi:ATP-dependent 26S proteasome regulatory subunit
VYVRDLYDIYSSKSGENVIRRLANVIKKQRRAGNRIILVGATAQDAPGPFNFAGNPEDDLPFRTITIPPCFTLSAEDMAKFGNKPLQKKTLDKPAYGRILEINIRHIQSMLRRMRPHDNLDLLSIAAYKQMNMPGTRFLTERVLSLDQVQRLALTAVGLTKLHAKSGTIQPVHLALASFVTSRSDHVFQSWSRLKEKRQARNLGFDGKDSGQDETWSEGSRSEARMERIRKSCNQHETRLLTGVVDSERIKIGFGDVHAPLETIDALKTLTSLSLLRPDAFKYGVLANDRLPGLLLYGPPGTGKTMLAKAVAKESQATVMEISGAQIYEKYVGEGEKMVRAVFSLAKKLSPCVVFIDEGDALLGSRSSAGNRNTHREIINQFLREWDGMSMDMDGHNVFIMVASNRPFDLDDAVLRRLPRRLLIDLPVAKDRESILGIHLRQESLDSTVSLNKLAEQTPFYSGSDLKNLAVSAALACVREENELSESRKDDKEFRLPEKRTLTAKHFEKALAEISASISEDMSSLTAIRKFDEQYGDRRGRRKRTGYGFGAIDSVVDESAARIRQAESSAHPPPP